uniref:Uncharacterized protein At5g01610 n=1 Tax=Anthurium amnicola TaxID=1678845 RepID=A0A1D1YLT4_9ARAE
MATAHHLLYILLAALQLVAPASGSNGTVYDLLPVFGLPRGLLPGNVVNYTRSDDGGFAVELSEPCYVQFSELAYYERTITGKISYGLISSLTGIQARKFYIWVAITRIAVDSGDDTIQFDTGVISEKHPASEFDHIRPCKKWASSSSSSSRGDADAA